MNDVKRAISEALREAIVRLGHAPIDVPVQEVPDDKPGDYGSPVAFMLAKTAKQPPTEIARAIVATVRLPDGVRHVDAVGPYINVDLDAATFVRSVASTPSAPAPTGRKVIVEHTSVNPNKEAHVGHLRNIVLGDAVARLLRAEGHQVEVQNYVDDTGRQAAESLFAAEWFGEQPDGREKLDVAYGRLYVRLAQAKDEHPEEIERGVREVMRRLEHGELRPEVEGIVHAQLTTFWSLGVDYDLLVWESDVVASGFLDAGLDVLRSSRFVSTPSEGPYAGTLVMDVSAFLPGLEESNVVLVRSDGNAMYVAKDIGYQFWKAGLVDGMTFAPFATSPRGTILWSSASNGEEHPDGHVFGRADEIVNVIDARQSHPQTLVKAALALTDTERGRNAFAHAHHLAYEVVTLEGQAMSGRKGITLAIDDVVEEAIRRAAAVIAEKTPDLPNANDVARQVGLGALRFAMLKSEAKRMIDFRWNSALDLQGDSAPYVQYAHARACSILRAADASGLDVRHADFDRLGPLEVRLARWLARFPDVRRQAAADLAPHQMAQYALDVAAAWNAYYNHRGADGRPDTAVVRAEPGLREARLVLVQAVARTLADALALLGIEAPETM